MLLFSLRSAQGFYFSVLSRIENCQHSFPPPSSQDLSMCNHCWLESPFSGTQLCCLDAHPSLLASVKCFTGSCFYSSQSELHITSNVPLQNNNDKISTQKNQTKKPPKIWTHPVPQAPGSAGVSLGYPPVCHEKRCSWTGIRLGLSWEFQVLACTFPPGISPLFWHGRTLFPAITFGSWRCLMVTHFSRPPSAEKKKNVLSYNGRSCRILCPCWMLHNPAEKPFVYLYLFSIELKAEVLS